jgi:hypothetical protein
MGRPGILEAGRFHGVACCNSEWVDLSHSHLADEKTRTQRLAGLHTLVSRSPGHELGQPGSPTVAPHCLSVRAANICIEFLTIYQVLSHSSSHLILTRQWRRAGEGETDAFPRPPAGKPAHLAPSQLTPNPQTKRSGSGLAGAMREELHLLLLAADCLSEKALVV